MNINEMGKTKSGRIYKLVGHWGEDLVFAPTDGKDTECLVYCQSELDEMLASGTFEEVRGGATIG